MELAGLTSRETEEFVAAGVISTYKPSISTQL